MQCFVYSFSVKNRKKQSVFTFYTFNNVQELIQCGMALLYNRLYYTIVIHTHSDNLLAEDGERSL